MILSESQINLQLAVSDEQHSKILAICGPLFRFSKFDYFSYCRFLKTEKKWCGIHSNSERMYKLLSSDILPPYIDESGGLCIPAGYYHDDQLRAALVSRVGEDGPNRFYRTIVESIRCGKNESGFYILRHGRRHDEVFFFSGAFSGDDASSYVDELLPVLKRFCCTFLHKGRSIIKAAEKHKLRTIPYQKLQPPKLVEDEHTQLQRLYEVYQPTKFLFEGPSGEVLLSRQEKACLAQLALCKSYGDIAQTLGLSHRTVESYIVNAKNKLNTSNKLDLIEAYHRYQVLYQA